MFRNPKIKILYRFLLGNNKHIASTGRAQDSPASLRDATRTAQQVGDGMRLKNVSSGTGYWVRNSFKIWLGYESTYISSQSRSADAHGGSLVPQGGNQKSKVKSQKAYKADFLAI
jgi:hypothetical protein